MSRPNKGSEHWSQSTFGSFQSAARLRKPIGSNYFVPMRRFGPSFLGDLWETFFSCILTSELGYLPSPERRAKAISNVFEEYRPPHLQLSSPSAG